MAPADVSAGRPATCWQEIQGAKNWEGLLEPLNPDLREAGLRYGEFVEAVYDALDIEADTEYIYYSLFSKSELFSRVGLEPGYNITKYLYCTVVVDGWGKMFGLKEGASTVWMGYIAVSNDEETKRLGRRDVVVAFRGTMTQNEWWKNIHINMVNFKELGPAPFPKVLSGFLSMYTASDPSKMFGGISVKEQLFRELKRLIQVQYNKEDLSITFAGHSLGGALAQLAAPDFGFNMPAVDPGRTVMVTAFVFRAPKTGDAVFKERANKYCKVIRVVDTGDPVPMVPPSLPLGGYKHIGVKWKVNWADSPNVQHLGWVSSKCHNLELYLHCIAGQKTALQSSLQKAMIEEGAVEDDAQSVQVPEELLQSLGGLFPPTRLQKAVKKQAAIVKASKRLAVPSQPTATSGDDINGPPSAKRLKLSTPVTINFELAVKRDPALMNKSDDIVIPELEIPKSWWVHPFKNMRNIAGKWLPRYQWPDTDIPSEDNPEFN